MHALRVAPLALLLALSCSSERAASDGESAGSSPAASGAADLRSAVEAVTKTAGEAPAKRATPSARWLAVPGESLPQTDAVFSATELSTGKVLVVGGDGEQRAWAALFDPAARSWAKAPDLPIPLNHHRASSLESGKVLLTGGLRGTTYLDAALLFDPASGTWSKAAPMPGGRANHSSTLLPSGKVLVAGGARTTTSFHDSAAIFDPDAGSWSKAKSMPGARASHAATLLESGKVLVTGGIGAGDTALDSAAIFDPATGEWSPAESMPRPRSNHAAVLLPTGRVMVVGGDVVEGSAAPLLYDPDANSWSEAPALPGGCVLQSVAPYGQGSLVGVATGCSTTAWVHAPRQGDFWTETTALPAGFRASLSTPVSSGDVIFFGWGEGPSAMIFHDVN